MIYATTLGCYISLLYTILFYTKLYHTKSLKYCITWILNHHSVLPLREYEPSRYPVPCPVDVTCKPSGDSITKPDLLIRSSSIPWLAIAKEFVTFEGCCLYVFVVVVCLLLFVVVVVFCCCLLLFVCMFCCCCCCCCSFFNANIFYTHTS